MHDLKRVIWFALRLTLLACVVVAVTVMLLYPPDQWRWELGLSLSLTVTITMTMTCYIGLKIREIERLSEQLRQLVERDRLTDAATRDHLYGQVSALPARLGVTLMVDIDHFKRVNDTYGHQAGDVVIKAVAQAMRETVRADDIVCRFGGEEFLVFLADHEAMDALAVAERMRQAVAALDVQVSGQAISVTVSIGVSDQGRMDQIEEAIRQADAALYRAKSLGRDRTVYQNEAIAP